MLHNASVARRDEADAYTSSGLVFALLSVLVLGVISGCVLWNRCFTAVDEQRIISVLLDMLYGYSIKTGVAAGMLSLIMFMVLLFACSFFVLGWVCVPSIIFIYGLGLGAKLCTLFSCGVINNFAAVLLCISVLAALPVLIAFSVVCARASGSLTLFQGKSTSGEFKRLFVRIPLFLAAAAFTAFLQLLICRLAAAFVQGGELLA